MADHKKTQPETVLNRRGALGLAAAVATFGAAMGIDVSDANSGIYLKYSNPQGGPERASPSPAPQPQTPQPPAPQPLAPQLQTPQPIKEPTTLGAPGSVQQKGEGGWETHEIKVKSK
jgi:hypothetical protein